MSTINILEGSKIRKLLPSLPLPVSKEDIYLDLTYVWKQWYIYVPITSAICHYGSRDPRVQHALVTLPTLWAEPAHPSFEISDSNKEILRLVRCWLSVAQSKQCDYNPVTDTGEVWIISF